MAVIIPMLIVTIAIGELFIFLSIKIKPREPRKPEEYEMITNELTLLHLLKNTIQTEFDGNLKNKSMKRVLNKKFIQIHNRENYRDELNAAANLLFFGNELSKAYANLIYKIEQQFHKGNIIEMHICIKKHLGTNETSQHFYGLIKSPDIFSRIIPKQLIYLINKISFFLNMNKHALRLEFLLKVTLKTIVYYLDLVKDVFLIVSISSFIPFSTSKFESFEIQVVLILCLSITFSIFSNTLLILFNNSVLILRSCKMRLAFAMISVLSPSVAQYIIQRLHLQQKLINSNFIEKPNSNERQIIKNINYVKHLKWYK